MPITIDLAGKVALITGASQGIGARIAWTLHTAGATVVINHPGTEATIPDAAKMAADLNGERAGTASVFTADVCDSEAVAAMMSDVKARFGGLDILVCNAGILRDRSIAKMIEADWKDVIDVNLTGVFHACKYGLEVMNPDGCIVNIGSLSAEAGFHGQANYAAAKAGVHALTRVLSRECAKRGIRVNAVAPGLIDTAMIASVSDQVRAGMHAMIPLGRVGRPR